MESSETFHVLVLLLSIFIVLLRALKLRDLFKHSLFNPVECADSMTPDNFLLSVSATHFLTNFDDICDQ